MKKMVSTIFHRGQNHEGFYSDEIIHFRFVQNEQKPLSFENERYWIVFDGEIYNDTELRKQLMKKGLNVSKASQAEIIVSIVM